MYALGLFLSVLLALPTHVFGDIPCSGTITSTGGRKIAVVIDSSGSMTTTDPNNLRITAGESIVAALLPSDRVTVIDFDDSVRIVSPLGPPSTASFAGIDSDGGTFIAGGVDAAITELTKNPNDVTSQITGIVVLTDGEDSDTQDLVDQINRAGALGIRVSFGFLSPFDVSDVQDPSVLSAILSTNGIYSTIDSDTAQANFVNLVLSHGLADVDSPTTGNTLLLPGLVTAGNVSASSGSEAFTYDSQAGEVLNFTITAITDLTFDVKLRDKTANKDIQSLSTDVTTGIAIIAYTVPSATELELDVSTTNTTGGLFSVSLQSSVNRTIAVCGSSNSSSTVGSSTTILSSTSTLATVTAAPSHNVTATSTFKPTPTTTTSSGPTAFTGAATSLQGFAVAAVFPVLMALML